MDEELHSMVAKEATERKRRQRIRENRKYVKENAKHRLHASGNHSRKECILGETDVHIQDQAIEGKRPRYSSLSDLMGSMSARSRKVSKLPSVIASDRTRNKVVCCFERPGLPSFCSKQPVPSAFRPRSSMLKWFALAQSCNSPLTASAQETQSCNAISFKRNRGYTWDGSYETA